MLEAMLELRHPDKQFEVVNAAMTGINSHVILPLARDCRAADGDVWVIYMGNNEVVGPFGAGTVFGSQIMPLPLIRAGLALKSTRIGQLLDALRGTAAQKTSAGNGEWEGMRAFINYKVADSDPRLGSVYENFERNLKDIIAAGQNSGAKIVLSTVAVNLKDCAPFASLHRLDLSESSLKDWQRLFDTGTNAQINGDFREAATDYDEAAKTDDTFAELRFRRGQCALALNDSSAARKEFAAARDLDALRFRCDSRLNRIIRGQAIGNVMLADSERALAGAVSDGLPGIDFFYEHVHFTFQGNYIIARAIAEQVENALTLPENDSWPDASACARRLGYTLRDTQLALSEMLGRLSDMPFTMQANHRDQMQRLREAARQFPPPNSASSLYDAQSSAEAALARWGDDATLWEQLGEIKQAEGDYAGAAMAAQRSLNVVPSSPECWLLDGVLLAQQEKYEEAVAAFERVFALNPQAVWARHNLAMCLEKLGRRNDAVVELKRALAVKPEYGTAWLALGNLYEQMGRTNDAEPCFRRALTNRVNQADDLAALARFCAGRHWFDLAITNFAAAIELSPSDARLHMEAGRTLAAIGRHEDAAREYQAAVELNPDDLQPHMEFGIELGRLRKPALAEKEFRQALRLNPNSISARVDLGVALYEQQLLDEALKQFDDVLQRNPKDATALRYAQLLRNRKSSPTGQ
jgi:tetratricopeptide (TPR) repeat protein